MSDAVFNAAGDAQPPDTSKESGQSLEPPVRNEEIAAASEGLEDHSAHEFQDCDSPQGDKPQREGAVHPISFINDEHPDGSSGVFEIMQNIDVKTQFPIPPDEIWRQSKQIKAGTLCSIVWAFANQEKINMACGKVVRTHSKRGGMGKLSMQYTGISGYKEEQEYTGSLPPQENVRIFRIIWHQAPPPIDVTVLRDSTIENHLITLTPDDVHGEGVDLLPIPTVRNISPDLIPCVIATFREIVKDYINADHQQRNIIWHRLLSAMKLSLAGVRRASGRSRRQRPYLKNNDDKEDQAALNDRRAIKRATRLVTEGCASKAARVLDQAFTPSNLPDEETLDKLSELHPQKECDFRIPADAPIMSGIEMEELRAAGKRLAKGANPGPTGMTDSIVRLLLDDELCCINLCHMICDLINGFLGKDVIRRINRSRLVAIPKSCGGVRPVAMGEVLNKLAGIVLMQRYEHTLAPLFAPMQQGAFSKAGCEKIVHQLRNRHSNGYSILSVDVKNAFNSPSRMDIAKHVLAFSALRPFQRFFEVEYSGASELLYYGSEGKLVGTVLSTSGLRQGSPLASMYYCAFFQPMLETLSMEFPEVEFHAFIDDVTMSSLKSAQIEKAFQRLQELMVQYSLTLATKKCIWFGEGSAQPIPPSLKVQGVRNEEEAVKVLGAHIGKENQIKKRLMEAVDKQDTSFQRLKAMGLSNVALILLSQCINVKQQYVMRVHPPSVTKEASTKFDDNVESVLKKWLGPLTEKQVEMARLPMKKGGLGLTSCSKIREAAYLASRYQALERIKSFTARAWLPNQNVPYTGEEENSALPPMDEVTTAAVLHEKVVARLKQDPEYSNILRVTTRKGNYDWLKSEVRFVPSHAFEIPVMARLGIPHPRIPATILCPGCKTLLNNKTALVHIPGCAQCSGQNATVKHNRLVKYLFDLSQKSGIPCEREPRAFSSWKCATCKVAVNPENRGIHEKTCSGRQLFRSGPDLVIYWSTGELFYDLTVIHELAPSIISKTCANLAKEAIKRKHQTYVESGKIPDVAFQCLPVFSCGSLHQNTRFLIHALADAACLDRHRTEMEFKLLLQEQNGLEVYAQLRSHLADRKVQELSV